MKYVLFENFSLVTYLYIYNFSDDVLNPNGERFGSSDIYYASKSFNFIIYANILIKSYFSYLNYFKFTLIIVIFLVFYHNYNILELQNGSIKFALNVPLN